MSPPDVLEGLLLVETPPIGNSGRRGRSRQRRAPPPDLMHELMITTDHGMIGMMPCAAVDYAIESVRPRPRTRRGHLAHIQRRPSDAARAAPTDTRVLHSRFKSTAPNADSVSRHCAPTPAGNGDEYVAE